jgi:hypothetical protein
MKAKLVRVAMLMISMSNTAVFGPWSTASLACTCTGKAGGKCEGKCCITLASGECNCWDPVGKCTS